MAQNRTFAATSPGEVLATTVARLKDDPDTDTDLLEIVWSEVLEAESAWNVKATVKTIEALAAKRAAMRHKEPSDG